MTFKKKNVYLECDQNLALFDSIFKTTCVYSQASTL